MWEVLGCLSDLLYIKIVETIFSISVLHLQVYLGLGEFLVEWGAVLSV